MKRVKVDPSSYDTPEMRALVQEELESLRKDPLVYPTISNDLKLTNKEAERFLASLLDYQEDVRYCASCPGIENCAKSHPHFCLRLERDGEVLSPFLSAARTRWGSALPPLRSLREDAFIIFVRETLPSLLLPRGLARWGVKESREKCFCQK